MNSEKTNRTESNQKSLNNQSITDTFTLNLAHAFDYELGALPFEQREAFCLQQEGFGLQEIADITHSKIETVKSRLRYAKTTLRNNLEKYHD